VSFSLDGRHFDLDLCDVDEGRFMTMITPYLAVARRAGPPRFRTRSPAERQQSAAARAWALQNGHKVPAKGRLPESVMADYEAAQRGSDSPAAAPAPVATQPPASAPAVFSGPTSATATVTPITSAKTGPPRAASTSLTAAERAEIRTWARGHGFDIGTRGAIRGDIIEAWRSSKGSQRRRAR
jgi:hypothetical protein